MTRALVRQFPTEKLAQESVSSSTLGFNPQQSLFHRVAPKACALIAFFLPLKLSLTYIVLVPLLLAFAWNERRRLISFISDPRVSQVTSPMLALLGVALCSALLGLSLSHSLPSLLSLIFFCTTIPLFALHADTRLTCSMLVVGQSIAALHSFFEAALPGGLSRLFLGHVTESGQLALTIPVAVGLCVINASSSSQTGIPRQHAGFLLLVGLVTTASLVLLGFATEANLSAPTVFSLAALAIIGPLLAIRFGRQLWRLPRHALTLSSIQIPLLICALVVNLKRGPWIGTLLAASVFCLLYARRLVVFLVACAIALACTITPVRERLLDSYEHFTISGGRSTIWRIGAELATEYPLGIGYHNSGIMREFAPEIPPELKHFHNNFINITTELGWLGGAVFVWFLVSLLRLCFRDRSAPLYTAIGCALIAWQTAGLFEYNFGDSEVTIIVWALTGLVLQREYQSQAQTSAKS